MYYIEQINLAQRFSYLKDATLNLVISNNLTSHLFRCRRLEHNLPAAGHHDLMLARLTPRNLRQ